MIPTLQIEFYLLYLAGLFYTIFGIVAILNHYKQKYYIALVVLALSGLVLHGISIGVRWSRIGHGPFINLYEILTSNVWSLFLGFTLFFIFFRKHISIAQIVLPVIAILLAWLLGTDPKDTFLPPTYNTIWLYFHVISGKIFLSLLLLASGLAALTLLKCHQDKVIQRQDRVHLAYHFLAMAFVFDSFMLFFGAVWAQDAWGRYWAWDPLETWSFLSWLVIAFVLHLRASIKKETLFCWLIIASFALAFLTFFGVPFISTAPHKGMI